MADHKLTLFLREEPEGHGTLFMTVTGECEEGDLEAVGIIERDAMEANSCTDELQELLKDHSGFIAERMLDFQGE